MSIHETRQLSSINGTPTLNEPHPSPTHISKEPSVDESDHVLHTSRSQVRFAEHPPQRRVSQPNNSPASTLSPVRPNRWGSSTQKPTNLLARLYHKPETSDVLRMIKQVPRASETTTAPDESLTMVSL